MDYITKITVIYARRETVALLTLRHMGWDNWDDWDGWDYWDILEIELRSQWSQMSQLSH